MIDKRQADRLAARRGAWGWLSPVRDQPGADVDGVRLATMHAMTGLEFRGVAVVGPGRHRTCRGVANPARS